MGVATPAAMIAAVFAVLALIPSGECFDRYDDAWCAAHADALAEAKPALADTVTTDNVGGYRVGDVVPSRYGGATIEPDDEPFLAAVERYVEPDDRRWVIETAAGESDLDRYADNPTSTAAGYMQALARWYRHPTLGGSPWDPTWQARITAWLLDNGGRGHWAYQP